MVTTIQINERTLQLLKKLKEETQTQSYDEAINRIAIERTKKASMGGSLKKYMKKGETLQNILKDLKNERRKSDRF